MLLVTDSRLDLNMGIWELESFLLLTQNFFFLLEVYLGDGCWILLISSRGKI